MGEAFTRHSLHSLDIWGGPSIAWPGQFRPRERRRIFDGHAPRRRGIEYAAPIMGLDMPVFTGSAACAGDDCELQFDSVDQTSLSQVGEW